MTATDTSDHFTESWDIRIDACLGGANKVLERATDEYVAGRLLEGAEEQASCLAEAWRDLATHWQERQRHAWDLLHEDEEYEDEEEDVDVDAEVGA